MFQDRRDAGRQLGAALLPHRGEAPWVLAIPRGGVVVGAEVAQILGAPLDVIIPRKLPAPHNPELAMGAVAHDGEVYFDPAFPAFVDPDDLYVRQAIDRERQEITRRMMIYRGRADYPSLEGKTAIIVDDGIATGSTFIAAARAVRKMGPVRAVAGIPVAPADALARLAREVDHVVCLRVPPVFYAVGEFYEDFAQTTDDEVVALLKAHGNPSGRDDAG